MSSLEFESKQETNYGNSNEIYLALAFIAAKFKLNK